MVTPMDRWLLVMLAVLALAIGAGIQTALSAMNVKSRQRDGWGSARERRRARRPGERFAEQDEARADREHTEGPDGDDNNH